MIGRLNIKNIVCRDLIAPQFHINIANAIEKMRKTKHFHFHLPLPPLKTPFNSEKQKKYSYMHIHKHTLKKMCTVILHCDFQRYHTTLASITLNKCPPQGKKKKIQPL